MRRWIAATLFGLAGLSCTEPRAVDSAICTVDYTVRSRTPLAARALGGGGEVRVELRARLRIDRTRLPGGEQSWLARFEDIAVKHSPPPLLGPDVGAVLRSELREPFEVRFAVDGAIVDFRVSEQVSAIALRTIGDVVSRLQVVRVAGCRVWRATERDVHGVKRVEYCRARDGRIRKRTLAYESSGLTEEPGGRTEVDAGEHGPRVIRSRGTLAVTKAGVQLAAIETEFAARFAWSAEARAVSEPRPVVTRTLAQCLAAQRDQMSRVGSVAKAHGVLQRLRRNDARLSDTDAVLVLRRQLRARPALLPALAGVLERGSWRERDFRVVAPVLAEVGTRAAQSVLVRAVGRHASDERSLIVLFAALADLEEPGDRVLELLESFAFASGRPWNVRSTAQLTLGTAVGRRRARDPAGARPFAARLLCYARQASCDRTRRQARLVLDNAGLHVPGVNGAPPDRKR